MNQDAGPGFFASLRQVLASSAELAEVRIKLFATELQEEKLRLLESLVWLAVSMLALGVALVLLSVFIVMLFGEQHRLAALGVLVALFLVAARVAWGAARAGRQAGGAPFEASLAELRRDRAALGGRDPTESP
jgi:uncharacterized membrane protein YqjE